MYVNAKYALNTFLAITVYLISRFSPTFFSEIVLIKRFHGRCYEGFRECVCDVFEEERASQTIS